MPGGCTPEIAFQNDPARAAKESNFTNINRYNHKQCYGRDLFVLSLLQKLEMPSLDMRALCSRSDAHPSSRAKTTSLDVDFLHMCSPGPLDIIAPMFQRLLTQIGWRKQKSRWDHKVHAYNREAPSKSVIESHDNSMKLTPTNK
jgi:hypothetical protein